MRVVVVVHHFLQTFIESETENPKPHNPKPPPLKKLDVASLSDALLQPRCPQALQVATCRDIRESIECLCTFCALLTVEGLDGGRKKNSKVFCNFPLCLSLSAGKKVSAELRVLKPRRRDISSWLCFFLILFHFFFFFSDTNSSIRCSFILLMCF